MSPRILPTMRGKSRYVMFKVISEEPVDFTNLKGAVMNSVLEWLGERGAAKADVWLIKNLWKAREGTGVLRCSHLFVDEIKTCLALVHQIGDHRVIIKSARVAGTLKSLAKKRRKGMTANIGCI